VDIDSKEKIPDHLVDFCKSLSVNQMAASSRLPMDPFSNFSNTPYVTSLRGCRIMSSIDLQHLCYIDLQHLCYTDLQHLCYTDLQHLCYKTLMHFKSLSSFCLYREPQ